MKAAIALFSLIAVASAASLPNTNTDTADVVARHESHSHMEHGKNRTEDDHGLNKRRRRCRVNCPHHHNNNNNNNNATSDATTLMNLNIGTLVAGVAGAGVGAILLY